MVKKSMLLIAVTAGLSIMIILPFATVISKPSAPAYTQEQIKHGSHLVMISGCNDCHSTKIMTSMGPVPDTAYLLAGHPSMEKVPDMPAGVIAPDKWGALTTNGFTAWAGPWGVSFAANLTPDNISGLGAWTEDVFVKALRTGKHMGTGRDILPPMPWPGIAEMSDSDLRDILAYLKSLKPIDNSVPLPIPPSK